MEAQVLREANTLHHPTITHTLQRATMKVTTGRISISYYLECPHCECYLDDYHDKDFFNQIDFADGPDEEFEVTCTKCKEEFIINGFQC